MGLFRNDSLGCDLCLEDLPNERGAIIYGGLGMLPRFNMAINLVRHHKAAQHITRSLVDIQDGIAQKRNQAVHGVHGDADDIAAIRLTMLRWPRPKRTNCHAGRPH